MSSFTIQLPAGTNIKKAVNLPVTGGWVGACTVSLAVTGADATIHEWYMIWPDAHTVGTHFYRRVGGTIAQNWKEWTLKADSRQYRGLYAHEQLTTISYTSTNDISLCVETTRSATPTAHPDKAGEAFAGHDFYGKIFISSTPPDSL